MSDRSARLALPFIQPTQAQKHVTHNEALERFDLLVQLVVEEFDAISPPDLPEAGRVWALGETPSGAWAGHGGDLAARVGEAWLFIAPQTGWRAWGREEEALRIWTGAQWAAPEAAAPDFDNLSGVGINTSFDATNRLSVAAPATLLSHEGAGHQLKIDKAASADTASLLFQTGWSGRAEMGTVGNDDFAIKVSPDGASWHEAVVIDRTSGQAQFPSGAQVSGSITADTFAGPGAAALPALISDETDTGTVTTDHDRAVIASVNAQASGQRAVVMASDGAVVSGDSAMAFASDGSVLSGTRAFAASSLDGAIGGYDGALISTLECECSASGWRQAVVASFDSQADAGDAMVACSRRVVNDVNRSLALGDAGSGDALTANRKIHMLAASGDMQIAGSLSSNHNFSDFAEMFANATGAEIPPGTVVAESGGAVHPAGAGEEIAGLVSTTAVVTAGDTPFAWQGRYLTDEWGRALYDEVPDPDFGGEGAAPLIRMRRENPDWDPSLPQVPRSERPDEWTRVGLLGQVFTRVGADVQPGDRLAAEGGIGVRTSARIGLRCMTITSPHDAARGA